jgi:hypothetical protein
MMAVIEVVDEEAVDEGVRRGRGREQTTSSPLYVVVRTADDDGVDASEREDPAPAMDSDAP